jgi:hypothetical protein
MPDIPENQNGQPAFETLARYKIPFARVFGGAFAPSGLNKYQQDKEAYFAYYDRLVRLAETHRIGLIPSLFWNPSAVPALVGERVSQWGNANSKTRQFMRQYAHDFVERYKQSPAIWGWEFGNEYNLVSDLPKPNWYRPTFLPGGYGLKAPEAVDQLTHEMICATFQDFAKEVRKQDPDRMISSGCSMPRKSAWHLWKQRSWTDDSPQHFEMILAGLSLAPQNIISIHAYDDDAARIVQAMQSAQRLKKPMFLGEFGVKGVSDATKREFLTTLALIEKEKVPLAALWVYNRPGDEGSWNVNDTNERSYQLKAIADSDQRIRDELGVNWPGDW